MRRSPRYTITAPVVVLMLSFTTLLAAQVDRDAMGALYRASATLDTNIAGIHTFPAAPEAFNPLNASDTDLAAYGFPPRPNKETDPQNYAHWTRAMAAAKIRWNGKLRDMGASSMSAQPAHAPATPDAGSATPGTTYYYNWSGIANTNKLTTWNKNNSFYYVISSFNVPAVQPPFDTCDGGYDWEVSWNGIDGFSNGDVLQGGSSSQEFCSGGKVTKNYCGWVEWYPSYPILCEFDVNPGDDFYVESYDPSGGYSDGYVYIEDETTLQYGTYSLSWLKGPALVGNSAEYIVERPCCKGSNNYPLANYIWDFWANSYAYDFTQYNKGVATSYYPGSTTASTYLINMVDDLDDQVISVPAAQGKYGLFFYDTGCAYTGGCTP